MKYQNRKDKGTSPVKELLRPCNRMLIALICPTLSLRLSHKQVKEACPNLFLATDLYILNESKNHQTWGSRGRDSIFCFVSSCIKEDLSLISIVPFLSQFLQP